MEPKPIREENIQIIKGNSGNIDHKGGPVIFILIPTYNRASLLQETLDSILAQTYPNWECIIIDDNSNENMERVLEDYIKTETRFSYFLRSSEYSKGPSGCRNMALDIAFRQNAEFIQFFDDDDLMHPEKLELQITPFHENPDLELNICQYQRFISRNEIRAGV